ncbi:MAG TPA: iron uptake transporter deferrochelatase/peroxidase subunit [Pseudonocardiaceae bacterium]|jgi:deferrochelatase/peroxidase EfeB
MTDGTEQQGNVSRRWLLAGLGVLGAAGVAGGGFAGGYAVAQSNDTQPVAQPRAGDQIVPFRAMHQAGIVTAQQPRLMFAAFRVTATDPAELREMLRDWTTAATAMTRGQLVPGQFEPDGPPPDTGETAGLTPANLTITIGYGPSLFDHRFGLAGRRPSALVDLPHLPLDHLDPAFTGGDIAIQACADDPQVSFHAIRNLARIGTGTVVPLWVESGFGRTASTDRLQTTPRNLMGFKDGTRNIRSDQKDLLDQYVWIGEDSDQEWLRGGTYLVARRIRMFLNQWDRDVQDDQENVFGRFKATGAPLTGIDEFDTPNFAAKTASGQSVIPADAHIRLAAHENNDGLRILRRGYSFTDGLDSTGNLLGGLFFLAFMRDPQQFVTLQRKLGQDGLREYISHIGGAVFVCPPGLGTLPARATLAEQLFGTSP